MTAAGPPAPLLTPRRTLALLLLTAAAAWLHALRLSAELPPLVASHFNAAGRPNGWMPRGVFVAVYAGLVAFLGLVLAGAGAAIARTPDSMISLPNKDHWLHPARRQATLDWIRAWLYLFAAAVNLLLIQVMRLAARANLDGTSALDPSIKTWIGAFLALTLALVIGMLVRFRAPGPGARP